MSQRPWRNLRTCLAAANRRLTAISAVGAALWCRVKIGTLGYSLLIIIIIISIKTVFIIPGKQLPSGRFDEGPGPRNNYQSKLSQSIGSRREVVDIADPDARVRRHLLPTLWDPLAEGRESWKSKGFNILRRGTGEVDWADQAAASSACHHRVAQLTSTVNSLSNNLWSKDGLSWPQFLLACSLTPTQYIQRLNTEQVGIFDLNEFKRHFFNDIQILSVMFQSKSELSWTNLEWSESELV